MFGLLKNLGKATIRVATLPLAAAVDVVTLGGVLTDDDSDALAPATEKTLKAIGKDLARAIDEAGD